MTKWILRSLLLVAALTALYALFQTFQIPILKHHSVGVAPTLSANSSVASEWGVVTTAAVARITSETVTNAIGKIAQSRRFLLRKKTKGHPTAEFRDLKESDYALINDIRRKAIDGEWASLMSLVETIRASAEPDVREEYVKTIGEQGEAALPELTAFLDDPEENVAIEARSAWLNAMYQIADSDEKANVIVSVMCTVKNEEFVNQLADELRGLGEKIVTEAAQVLLESGNRPAVAVARQLNEEVTEE